MVDSGKSAKAGFFAGLIHLLFYPLDMARLHLIVSDGHSSNLIPHYRNSLHTLVSLYKSQGLFSLYRGIYLSVANGFSWSLFFYIYEIMKKQNNFKNKELEKFVVASETAFLSKIMLNPLAVIRTRVMTTRLSRNFVLDFIEAVSKVWRVDGIRGFYSGLLPGLGLSMHGAFHLYFYETLKEISGGETPLKIACCGSLSKMLSASLFHPLMTIRFRLQQEQNSKFLLTLSKDVKDITGPKFYDGVVDCVQKTWKREGIKGFYRGLGVSMVRLIPEYGLFFLVYERIRNQLS